jgi:uracil-DNA glycosylase family 4
MGSDFQAPESRLKRLNVARLTAADRLNQRIVACEKCPRLRLHCREMAGVKRASFRAETYFGRPVPNLGDPDIANVGLLIIGLAPAAHGANRTGRMFTGDRSGDFLFRALYEAGFANQPTSQRVGDGLELRRALITATAHCAPPGNKPTPEEVAHCAPFLDETFALARNARVVVCLGKIAFDAVLRYYQRRGWIGRMAPYKFGHGVEHAFPGVLPRAGAIPGAGVPTILGSYHPSQQNTFTGKLTPKMLRDVFERARAIVEAGS